MDSKDPKARFRLLLELADDELPLDVLCLLICQMAGDDIVIEHEQSHMDATARAMTPTFEGVISFLFEGAGGIRANTANYYAIDNSLLSRVRATGVGMPITMSVIAMECARRVGVPIVGIGLPGHFIVRSGEDDNLFADPFHDGVLLDREGVRSLFRRVAGDHAPWHDSFLAPVGNRDIVFRILNNLKVACTRTFEGRAMLIWVLELLSWFPQGDPFDATTASRLMSPYN